MGWRLTCLLLKDAPRHPRSAVSKAARSRFNFQTTTGSTWGLKSSTTENTIHEPLPAQSRADHFDDVT